MRIVTSLCELPAQPKKTCVALGLFDGLHLGHRTVIETAVNTAAAEGLTPAVFTFSARRGISPTGKPSGGRLFTSDIRSRLLDSIGVELMLRPPFAEFRGMTPEEFVREILHGRLNAAFVCCGENYHFGKEAAGTAADLRELCARFGIRAQPVPLVGLEGAPVSSTRIRACIAEGDMPLAARMLGRPFSIDFKVIHGRKLGRTLDFPTINQPIPSWFAVPRFGVYATMTTVDGRRHISVTNVGVKPTVGSNRLLCETWIRDYDGDLYGRKVLVEFLRFIRPERKFDSLEALREQIRLDGETAFSAFPHDHNEGGFPHV